MMCKEEEIRRERGKWIMNVYCSMDYEENGEGKG